MWFWLFAAERDAAWTEGVSVPEAAKFAEVSKSCVCMPERDVKSGVLAQSSGCAESEEWVVVSEDGVVAGDTFAKFGVLLLVLR